MDLGLIDSARRSLNENPNPAYQTWAGDPEPAKAGTTKRALGVWLLVPFLGCLVSHFHPRGLKIGNESKGNLPLLPTVQIVAKCGCVVKRAGDYHPPA
jgi:hypothetical protein